MLSPAAKRRVKSGMEATFLAPKLKGKNFVFDVNREILRRREREMEKYMHPPISYLSFFER